MRHNIDPPRWRKLLEVDDTWEHSGRGVHVSLELRGTGWRIVVLRIRSRSEKRHELEIRSLTLNVSAAKRIAIAFADEVMR